MDKNRLKQFVFWMTGALAFLVWPSAIVFANDVEELKHGVVKITAKNPNRIGTGVIVGIKGKTAYIATASHVIEGDPSPQVLFYQDAHPHSATIQGMEGGNRKGLAALVVEGDLPSGIRPIAFNAETQFTGGEKVTVIGFPRMVPVPWAVAEGTITGLVGPDLIFTGPVEEGNSGGPLLHRGRVIGLITDIVGSYKYAKPSVIAQYELKNWQLPFTEPGSPTPSGNVSQVPVGMVLIPDGTFQMGSPGGEGDSDEHPQHAVTLDAFYLDTHEVTNRQFQQFVQANSYKTTAEQEGNAFGYTSQDGWGNISGASWLKPEGKGSVFASGRETHPVVSISWEDAKVYCGGVGKRLPTEAEWEYAARSGGTEEVWAGTSVEEQLREYAVYSANYGNRTASVGGKKPNGLGLYDMSGNVWEWVADWYDEGYYQASPQKNPQGPSTGEKKVLRGGSWDSYPTYLRSANRFWSNPAGRDAGLGVRCAQDAR
jgi:formylglycine-generating enzyme required for sulfatase activity